MSDIHANDEGPPRAREGVAEAEAALETEHERYLKAARERTHAIADRLAKAAGYAGELRPGKIVRLKSGGPPMTIAVVDIVDELVYCHYFCRGQAGQARYSAEMLEPCAPSTTESFVPPTKPGIGDDWMKSRTRLGDEDSRGNPGEGDKATRARGKKTPESKANPKRRIRRVRAPAPAEVEAEQRRRHATAWRAHMRRIAHLKRLARSREEPLPEVGDS